MRNLALKSVLFINLNYLFLLPCCFAQEGILKVEQDQKFEILLREKQKMNSSLNANSINQNENYKIQIFYGTSDDAKKKLAEFKKEFKETEGTIVYTNPTFKVWVGNYKTRIHGEKAILEIKKKYPLSLLIKPNK